MDASTLMMIDDDDDEEEDNILVQSTELMITAVLIASAFIQVDRTAALLGFSIVQA